MNSRADYEIPKSRQDLPILPRTPVPDSPPGEFYEYISVADSSTFTYSSSISWPASTGSFQQSEILGTLTRESDSKRNNYEYVTEASSACLTFVSTHRKIILLASLGVLIFLLAAGMGIVLTLMLTGIIPVQSRKSFQCTPEYSQTILFAYSNDLDSDVVLESANSLASNYRDFLSFPVIANARFDSNENQTYYHQEWNSFIDSVSANLPNNTTPSSESKTTVFDILRKFLKTNNETSLCYARVYLLMSQTEENGHLDKLISDLQHHNVFVYSISPYQASVSPLVFEMCSLTNGLGIFAENIANTFIAFIEEFKSNYITIYAENIKVIGSGQQKLSQLTIDYNDKSDTQCTIHAFFAISVQDFGPSNDFQYLILQLKDQNSGSVIEQDSTSSNLEDNSTLLMFNMELNCSATYDVMINYYYYNMVHHSIAIRAATVVGGLSSFPPYHNFTMG